MLELFAKLPPPIRKLANGKECIWKTTSSRPPPSLVYSLCSKTCSRQCCQLYLSNFRKFRPFLIVPFFVRVKCPTRCISSRLICRFKLATLNLDQCSFTVHFNLYYFFYVMLEWPPLSCYVSVRRSLFQFCLKNLSFYLQEGRKEAAVFTWTPFLCF